MTTFYIALGIAIGAAVADLIHRYILPTYLDGRQDVQDEIDHSRRVAGRKAAQTRKTNLYDRSIAPEDFSGLAVIDTEPSANLSITIDAGEGAE